jgi:hypothetical protein
MIEAADILPELTGAAMQAWLASYRSEGDDMCLRQGVVKGLTTLLTWQGPWGLLLEPVVAELWSGVPLSDLCATLQTHPFVVSLLADLCALLEERVKRHDVAHYAASVAVCEKTFREEARIRVHVHAWMLFAGNASSEHAVSDDMFRDSTPYVAPFLLTGGRGKRLLYAEAFYVSVSKLNSILTLATKRPFTEYTVVDKWITSLLVAEKISAECARSFYLRCESSAMSNIRTFEIVLRE